MQIRTIIVLLFLAIGLITSSSVSAARSNNSGNTDGLSKAQRESVLSVCRAPRDILPAAQVSLRNYFRGNYLNSTFFKDFIWVHPEYVEFATCVVCLSGIPNDPYWESDFQLYCQEEATTLVKDELLDEQNGIL